MRKIGILGGTFDPIHIGHLIAADQALHYAKLDEIWFMPALMPPHKLNQQITPAPHRIEMVKGAAALDENYKLCTIELERSGPSYTIDTMKELKKRYPEDKFYFIIGGDMIQYLSKWHGIEELIHIVQFIGLERPGYYHQPKDKKEEQVLNKIQMIPMPQLDISSSQIREWIKMGRTIRYVVPSFVEEYIKEHRLYDD